MVYAYLFITAQKAQAGGGMGVPFHPLLCKEGRGEVEKGRKLHGAHTNA